MDVKLCFSRNGKNISIQTLRQLTNSSRTLAKAPFIKHTTLEVNPIRIQNESWEITRIGELRKFLISLFMHCAPYQQDSTFHLVSGSRIHGGIILDKKLWKIIRDLSILEAIRFRKQTLKIEYLNLVSPEKIDTLLIALEEK